MISIEGQVLFFQSRDGPFIPHLKLLHMFPTVMPSVQADRGAIKFVLAGSDIMDPGLTSEGGKLPEECIEKGKPVVLFAEGKEHPMAVGVLLKSTDEIKKQNEGKGVQNYHYIGDGLWHMWDKKK